MDNYPIIITSGFLCNSLYTSLKTDIVNGNVLIYSLTGHGKTCDASGIQPWISSNFPNILWY